MFSKPFKISIFTGEELLFSRGRIENGYKISLFTCIEQ